MLIDREASRGFDSRVRFAASRTREIASVAPTDVVQTDRYLGRHIAVVEDEVVFFLASVRQRQRADRLRQCSAPKASAFGCGRIDVDGFRRFTGPEKVVE